MTRPVKTLLLSLILLSFATFMFSELSGTPKLLAIVAVYMSLIFLALYSKSFLTDVGFSKSTLRAGVKLAAPFMLLIVAGVSVTYALSPTLFQDDRYQQDFSSLLITVFIIIPFYTVLLEELAFRGILLGRLSSLTTPPQANLISALAFGLWHVFSAQALKAPVEVPLLFIIVGVIFATTVAGLFFGWLRLRSGSIIAPVLVHWCINSAGVIAAFFAWQQ